MCKYVNYLPNDFVCPSGIIAQALDGVTDVGIPATVSNGLISLVDSAMLPSYLDRFPVVETFNFCEDLLISFYEVSELVQQTRPLKARNVFPPCSIESIASSGDGNIDVFRGSLT